MSDLLECPCCEKVFSIEKIASRRFSCDSCQEVIEPLLFPRLVIGPDNHTRSSALSQTSTCFFHPQKSAKSICGSCGVFICALCETTSGDQIRCIKCLEKGVSKEKDESFIQKATLYDGIALGVALLPLTLCFAILAPLTAPATLLLLLVYRKKSKSILPRTPWRWTFATLLALIQIVLILWLFIHK